MSFLFYFLAMVIILFGMILVANTAGLNPILFYDFVSLIFVFEPTIFIALASFTIGGVFRSIGLAFIDTKDKLILVKAVDCLNEMKSTSIASGFIGTINSVIVVLFLKFIVNDGIQKLSLSLGVSLIPTLYGLIAGYLLFESMKKNVQRQLDNLNS